MRSFFIALVCAAEGRPDLVMKTFRELRAARSTDLIAFNTALHGLTTNGDLSGALSLYDLLLMEESFSPDVVTFNTLMHGARWGTYGGGNGHLLPRWK